MLRSIETEVIEEDNGTFYKRQFMDYGWRYGGRRRLDWSSIHDPAYACCCSCRTRARWFADPTDPAAVEPPVAEKSQMELYRRICATPDRQKQIELMTGSRHYRRAIPGRWHFF